MKRSFKDQRIQRTSFSAHACPGHALHAILVARIQCPRNLQHSPSSEAKGDIVRSRSFCFFTVRARKPSFWLKRKWLREIFRVERHRPIKISINQGGEHTTTIVAPCICQYNGARRDMITFEYIVLSQGMAYY